MRKPIFVVALFIVCTDSFGQDSLNMNVLYHWEDTNLIYNEVWGFVENGREYAVVGSWDGTHFFDVTDPVNTVKVDYVPGTVSVCSPPCGHRDYHDYNGYLYMVADEDSMSTLQIVDLGSLPASVTMVYESNALFSNSHNIFIDSSSARLYSCGGDNNPGLRMFSLANPANPVEIANFVTPGGYVHDVYVRNDTAFLNAGGNGLFVYDLTVPGNPILLGSLQAVVDPHEPKAAYNHSGWLTDDGNTYVLAYETDGVDVYILDVSDLSNITAIDSVTSDGDSNAIPHNPIILGNYAYVSYYQDGVYIYDISDPGNTTVAGYYLTQAGPGSGVSAWGVYPLLPSGILLISDIASGFWVLDPSNAAVVDISTLAEEPGIIDVYPNPFTDEITISLTSERGTPESYKIYDLLGREIRGDKLEENSEITIQTGSLEVGFYLLMVKTKQGFHSSRITKLSNS